MTEPSLDRLYALCCDTRTADRVEADMTRMAAKQGAAVAALRADRLEWLAAQTRCAACDAVERCHDYLDGASDEPEEFCANAGEFAALADRG
mgnify:CR=1 FL=1